MVAPFRRARDVRFSARISEVRRNACRHLGIGDFSAPHTPRYRAANAPQPPREFGGRPPLASQIIVSGDRALLALGQHHGIDIVGVNEAIRRIELATG